MNSGYQYILLHKPYGVLSQFTADVPGQRTLAEFGLPGNVYAAGRLDSDSEGLLLLTDDGPFIRKLLEPGRGHERTYLVQAEGTAVPEALAQLESGVVIHGHRTLPAKVRLLPEAPPLPPRTPPVRVRLTVPDFWMEIRLREGKNRQVRRMTAAVGYPTLRLVRTAIGEITLGNLLPGEWRALTPQERVLLKTGPSKPSGKIM